MACLHDTDGKLVEECGCRKCAMRIKLSRRTYKPSGKKTLAELRLDRELDLIFEREKNA
jgi:hypothetical protein